MPGVKLRVAETDFISCARGVNMDKGQNAIVQLMSGAYHNATATDSAIIYNSNNFTTAQTISITSNSWNNTGKFIEGFDFTRSDGRDANVILESNAGIGNKNPNCKIGVLANVTPTTITTGSNWYKANWTNTNATTCKWTVANNRITYQPINRKNGWFMITGNVSCGSPNRTVSIAVVKNGVTTTRYAETSVRCLSSGQPFQFSTVVYLSDIGPGDYFEIFCSTNTSGDNIIMQDVQWLANAQ